MQHTAQRVSTKLPASRHSTADARARAEGGDPLASYFRDVSRHAVMGREEELAAACLIATQRQVLWRALLAEPGLATVIGGHARALLASPPEDELKAFVAAASALLLRRLPGHRRGFAGAREALALALAEVDVDGVVADKVAAELEGRVAAGAEDGRAKLSKARLAEAEALARQRTEVQAGQRALAAAKQRFIRANLRLVVMVARRFSHGPLALHDLIQEGTIGLMKAGDRFDPKRGFRFSTYASWWIRHSISRALADTGRAVRLPVHMIDAQAKVARVHRDFAALHGRPPTDPELAEAAGLSIERIQRMRWSLVEGPVSLDAPVKAAPGRTMQDILADADAPVAAELMDSELLHHRLREAFAALPAMEAAVLRERMGMDDQPEQTLREIGERHALSRERIRQIQEQGLARLRREFVRHDLM